MSDEGARWATGSSTAPTSWNAGGPQQGRARAGL